MGVLWSGRWSRIDVRDGIALLAFVDSGRVVAAVEHPRGSGDVAFDNVAHRASRASARFVVDMSDRTWTVLRPKSRP